MLLNNTHVSKTWKDFENCSTANIEFSQTKMVKLGGFDPFSLIRGFWKSKEQIKKTKKFKIYYHLKIK